MQLYWVVLEGLQRRETSLKEAKLHRPFGPPAAGGRPPLLEIIGLLLWQGLCKGSNIRSESPKILN